MVFPYRENYAHNQSLHQLHGQGAKEVETMTRSRRTRLDDDLARNWLAKHAQKQTPKPEPKRQSVERWQKHDRDWRRERRALAKPLLKGVE
jgi:hypothetical protein